jgi:hypothetical protein
MKDLFKLIRGVLALTVMNLERRSTWILGLALRTRPGRQQLLLNKAPPRGELAGRFQNRRAQQPDRDRTEMGLAVLSLRHFGLVFIP